ncbi:MAG TPA: PQQ-binding-like beta-propeller repeat protein [Solirubrobacterales bacterium]|nr:PQQ-binding-like beta-propeller repeat protein [Solirubrobacterales bacterium]
MKSRGRKLTSAGAILLLGLLLTVLVAACGGGGSSSSSTAEEATTTEGESSAVAEGGETEAWTLPNVNVQNTRAIKSDINAENVSTLKPAWAVTVKGSGIFGSFAGGPVFSPDGKSVYLQDLANDVFAVNVESGEIEWEYDVPASATNGEGPNGVAYYEGNLYGETNTAAFALSAETGEKVWETPNLAEKVGQGFNIQPQPFEGKIFLSTSGQLKGGIAYALDAKTGKVLWEFEETKEKKDKEAGGELGTGGAWNAPAIGPEGEVFFGIANPYRSIETAIKEPTKLLYNNSTVSLDQETGKLNWYMQSPSGTNDFHDWDMQVAPIYVEETKEPMVIDAGKMGYVYSMNPKTGRLNWETPVGIHNGHDLDGLHALEGKFKKPKLPYVFYPGILGGVETNMAVAEGMAFVPINDLPSKFKTISEPIASQEPPSTGKGEMVAVDLETGEIAWETKLPSSAYGDATYSEGVVYTTTFSGEVVAFDAKTGKILWQAKLPAGANSPVAITGEYLVTGAGYPEGKGETPQVVAFKLGASGKPVESELAAGGPEEAAIPGAETEDKSGEGGEKEGGAEEGASSTLAAGEETFDTNCSTCHTLAAAGTNGTVGPNLDELKPNQALVEKQVTNGGGGMPAFGETLSKEEIKNVAEFVSHWAGKKLTPQQEKLAKENGSAGGP